MANNNRNSTIDIIKAVLIILIILTHYSWTVEQRQNVVFPLVIDMAVPIFMFLSGYVGAISFDKRGVDSLEKAYSFQQIIHKFIRYTIPYLFFLVVEFLIPTINKPKGSKSELLKWIINGAEGPGSYYYPILVQLIFLFPLIYFIIFRNHKYGIWICLLINLMYELLKWSYDMGVYCYRLLIFRYIFILAFGIHMYRGSIHKSTSIALVVLGGIFIVLTRYEIYSPRIITFWTGTSCLADMWIIPLISFIVKKVKIHLYPLEMIGRASYNIFFVQMIYYSIDRTKLSLSIKSWIIELIIGVVICLVVGIVFFEIESRITRLFIKNLHIKES